MKITYNSIRETGNKTELLFFFNISKYNDLFV